MHIYLIIFASFGEKVGTICWTPNCIISHFASFRFVVEPGGTLGSGRGGEQSKKSPEKKVPTTAVVRTFHFCIISDDAKLAAFIENDAKLAAFCVSRQLLLPPLFRARKKVSDRNKRQPLMA